MALYWPSLIISVLVLIPNLLLIAFPPRNGLAAEPSPSRKMVLLTGLERLGQVAVTVTPVLSRFDVDVIRSDPGRFAAATLCLLVYYAGWVRFYGRGRDAILLFAPLAGIPLPLAISPILYFAFMAGVIRSLWLLVGAFVLAIGHVPVSQAEFRRLQGGGKS